MVKTITQHEKCALMELHAEVKHEATIMGCSAAAAAFLLIGALIVITCGCWCLKLGVINVIAQVIQPVVIPGCIAILASLPLLYVAYVRKQRQSRARGEMIESMIGHLSKYKILSQIKALNPPEEKNKKKKAHLEERVKFILVNFFNWTLVKGKLKKNRQWTFEYQSKIISELKDTLGKKDTWKKEDKETKEKLSDLFDEVRTEIYSDLK